MLARRTATALSRRAFAPTFTKTVRSRPFATSFARREEKKEVAPSASSSQLDSDRPPGTLPGRMVPFEEVRTMDDLLPPGAEPGTMPTDENQSTGLERLEILGKMQGVDIFDMRPLDASRKGTLEDPIVVYSVGEEQFAGCTGSPAGSHWTLWVKVDYDRPLERCTECGSCYRYEYIGPGDKPHPHFPDLGVDRNKPYDPHIVGHLDLIDQQNEKQWYDLVKPEYVWN